MDMQSFFQTTAGGFVLGLVGGLIVQYIWQLITRYRLYSKAHDLVGEWIPHNINGRHIEERRMPNAGTVQINHKHPKRWWTPTSHVLTVECYDLISETCRKRDHSGPLILDPVLPDTLATRIDRYDDSDELSRQDIVFSEDRKTMFVYPREKKAYDRHALRKKRKALDLTP